MKDDQNTEIRNKTDFFGATLTNSDDSPVQEVVKNDKVVAEIRNKTDFFGATLTNDDETPIKEVISKK